VTAATAVTAAAPAPYVIRGDTHVAGLAIARSTPADAKRRFGPPTTVRRSPPYSCVLTWRNIGVTLRYIDFGGGGACKHGALLAATIVSRTRWRTSVGLRVGDSTVRLRKLYPRARIRRASPQWSGYWLITRRACVEVGRAPYPGLLARVHSGRVTAIVAQTAACE
jgi:hypothetical protein